MKLSTIAGVLHSATLDQIRDGEFESIGLVSHETEGLLVFIEDERYLPELVASANIRCVLSTPDLAAKIPASLGLLTAGTPRAAFYRLHEHLATTDFYGPSFPTVIAKSARVHPRAYVAERNVRIGPGCIVEPNATILERAVLEEGVIVRAGAVVAGEGFQHPVVDGAILAVAHMGGARLEQGVELQHNTCVDRAVFGGFTVIGEDTKMDNHVHVAHNCRLGKRNRLAAATMIAGSVTTGDDVWFGPSCAISSGITIGARASITIGSVVTRDVADDARVTGNFAIDHERFIAHMKAIR